MQQELLPLFPLQMVLFPRTPTALHIFEDRYKEMMGESIERNTEFGVVLAGEKGIVNTGCTAFVDKVTEKYPDGRLDIIVVGRRRFELLDLDDSRPYLRAAVEFFDDDGMEEPMPEGLREKVLEQYQELLKLGDTSALLDPELTDAQISFQLAQVIADLNQRQLLLMSRSETDRMHQLGEYFPNLLRERRELSRARQSASTNGHGKRPAGLP